MIPATRQIDPLLNSPAFTDRSERRARRVWVSIIVGLLLLQVTGGIVTIYLAVSDPTVAVIPNYYQAGLNWEVKRSNLARFINLGWQIEITVDPIDREQPQRAVAIKLSKQGQPIDHQMVTADIYHHARGAEIHHLSLDESWAGEYVAVAKLTQPGLWHFEIMIDGDHGLAEVRFDIRVASSDVTHFVFPQTSRPQAKP